MIIGLIHPGSGLGDQLFRYITVRTLALDKGVDFGFIGSENFKGKDFMQLDWGKPVLTYFKVLKPSGKIIVSDKELWEEKTTYYNPEINFVEEGIIDGNFQDERYWGHRLNEIREWLKVEPLEMSDNLCVINFRGGEFSLFPDLFLTEDYWEKAIHLIADKYSLSEEEKDRTDNFEPQIDFDVHTDDLETASKFFPVFSIIDKMIALNWRSIRYAKHLILSNSAFGIIPALLNENVKEVIAPRYWARRNIKQWSLPSNYYKKFTYI